MIDLAGSIRGRRKAQGLKQYELARRAEMSPAQLCQIESGRVSPSFQMVERLAAALDLDTDFTAAFLMPGVTVRTYVAATGIAPTDWTFASLVAIKQHFGVSAEAFALRLEELGLIAPALRLELRDRLRAYYKAHPKAMEPRAKTFSPRLNSVRNAGGERLSCMKGHDIIGVKV